MRRLTTAAAPCALSQALRRQLWDSIHDRGQVKQETGEAAAVTRVAAAARDVLSASENLEQNISQGDQSMRALHLARLAAAVDELQSARVALDELLAGKSTY